MESSFSGDICTANSELSRLLNYRWSSQSQYHCENQFQSLICTLNIFFRCIRYKLCFSLCSSSSFPSNANSERYGRVIYICYSTDQIDDVSILVEVNCYKPVVTPALNGRSKFLPICHHSNSYLTSATLTSQFDASFAILCQ